MRAKQIFRRLLDRCTDIPTDADFAVVDSQIESTTRVIAHPRLVLNRSPFASIIGQRQQNPFVALQTFGAVFFRHDPVRSSRSIPGLVTSLSITRSGGRASRRCVERTSPVHTTPLVQLTPSLCGCYVPAEIGANYRRSPARVSSDMWNDPVEVRVRTVGQLHRTNQVFIFFFLAAGKRTLLRISL